MENPGATNAAVTLLFKRGAAPLAPIWLEPTVPSQGSVRADVAGVVLDAADSWSVSVSALDNVWVAVFGFELRLP